MGRKVQKTVYNELVVMLFSENMIGTQVQITRIVKEKLASYPKGLYISKSFNPQSNEVKTLKIVNYER